MKCKKQFVVYFKNVPLTNDEWEQKENRKARWLRDCSFFASRKYKDSLLPSKTKPVHRAICGGLAASELEAKLLCEAAIEIRKAQQAEYFMYAPGHGFNLIVHMVCKKRARELIWFDKLKKRK
jgi:hypothetical protein